MFLDVPILTFRIALAVPLWKGVPEGWGDVIEQLFRRCTRNTPRHSVALPPSKRGQQKQQKSFFCHFLKSSYLCSVKL